MNRGESKHARRRHEPVANSGGGVGRMTVGTGGTPLDARLLPAALGCWGVTIAGITLGWRAGMWVCAGLGLSVAGTGIVLARSRFRASHRAAWWVVLAALLASAGFGVAASWQAYRVSAHPLGRLAAGSVVTASGCAH